MRYGLIGEKLGHSFSKEIHEQIADYTYDLIPLNNDEFHQFMKEKNFKAINVTIPYKKAVIPYLDEIDSHAKQIGAVNTIVNHHGRLIGYNTDYLGFKYTIDTYHVNMKDKKVLILGNGGASAAIQACVKNEKPKAMIIVNRSQSDSTITYEECYQHHLDAEIIINTTPVGMYPDIHNVPIDLKRFKNCEAVMDLIYNPLNTMLCTISKNNGILACGGLEMLVAQAKFAVELFLNQSIDNNIIDKLCNDIRNKRKNIVLIGMPSCGKTTISKILSQKLLMPVFDIDEKIVKKVNKSIPEIFKEDGEETFRELESQVAFDLSKQNGIIISCGGGIIKKEMNMNYLKLNGKIYFIDRSLDLLISNDTNRPLSTSKEAVKKLYEERIGLYQKYADYIIENNTTLDDCIDLIVNTL